VTTPEHFRPETPDQLKDVLAWAAAEQKPLEVCGSGSKRTFGRPMAVGATLDVSGLAGIVLYEPEELVLTAKPGTPLAEIEAALAEKRQMLAFEPGDWSALLDTGAGSPGNICGTLGGAVACNLGGPRRIKAGAARDHLLGFHAVSGRGEVFKSGGRVVKNVTGFDLSKLISGSFGTLAVMTELTVRALPAPETTRTVLIFGCSTDEAVRAMAAALNTPFEVSGAAHLPPPAAARSTVAAVSGAGASVTAMRIEGPAPSVTFRSGKIGALLSTFGTVVELAEESATLWREVRDVNPLLAPAERHVWRLSLPPAQGAAITGRLLEAVPGEALFDWGGGLVWLALAPAADGHASVVRSALAASGGHATLVRAPAEVRAQTPVFQPQPQALAALTERVKDGFDPHRILNPGRMYAGV
jgi:glycolate oxidase FAD binding subunit